MTWISGAARLALGVALILPTSSAAELAAWDQAKVTEIAKQLPAATERVRMELEGEPSQALGSGDASAFYKLQQSTLRLHEQSIALAKHLEAGKGHDETVNYYKSFREVWHDSQENAQRSALPEPVMDAFAKVDDLFRRLSPYYDPKALEEPGSGN